MEICSLETGHYITSSSDNFSLHQHNTLPGFSCTGLNNSMWKTVTSPISLLITNQKFPENNVYIMCKVSFSFFSFLRNVYQLPITWSTSLILSYCTHTSKYLSSNHFPPKQWLSCIALPNASLQHSMKHVQTSAREHKWRYPGNKPLTLSYFTIWQQRKW